MKLGDLGILLVVGAFLYVVAKHYEGYAIIGASCAGLTGATLTACQKANKPKPKPVVKKIVVPKNVPFSTSPARTISKQRQKAISRSTGGEVGGPTTKAFECKRKGGTWKAYAEKGGTRFICRMPIRPAPYVGPPVGGYVGRPTDRQCVFLGGKWVNGACQFPRGMGITPTNLRELANNKCNEWAEKVVKPLQYKAEDNLAVEMGMQGIEELTQNYSANRSKSGGRLLLIQEKYKNMQTDLRAQCLEKNGYPGFPNRIMPGYDPSKPLEHAT